MVDKSFSAPPYPSKSLKRRESFRQRSRRSGCLRVPSRRDSSVYRLLRCPRSCSAREFAVLQGRWVETVLVSKVSY